MKSERILDAVGGINEEAVRDAKAYKKAKPKGWLKWGAMAACLCLVVGIGIFQITISNLPHKSDDPLSGGFVAEITEVVSDGHIVVSVTAGDHNLPEGSSAHINYEKVVCNQEKYDTDLIIGDVVVVTYDSVHISFENEVGTITIECIELIDE